MASSVLQTVYLRKEREFYERLEEVRNPNIIYVTDLVVCSQKRMFRLQMPLLSFRFEPSMVVGELVHLGLERILAEEGWRVEYEVSREFTVNGKRYVLKGRVDAVRIRDGHVTEVAEIKFARSVEKPLEHHVLQLRIYMELLNANEGILVYVTPDRIVEYSIPRSQVNLDLLVKETVLNLATPRFEWECKYCVFKKMCPYVKTNSEDTKRR